MSRRKKEVRKWNKESIQSLLDKNDVAVHRALIAIYNRQTDDEQSSENTYYRNDIGFSGVDGNILSSFAKQLLSRGFLSEKQMVIARKKMKKYWRQLESIATDGGKNPVVNS
jgi:hypothetical protein